MLHVQRFAIDHIYCAPGQDRQFSFKMVRVNKKQYPAKGTVMVYNTGKELPNKTSFFHVFTLGNIPPSILNLLTQKKHWYKDVWVRASDDMELRDYILKIYNDQGVMFPRQHVYYSFIDQNSLLVAIESLPWLRGAYPVDSFEYMHVYSNAYFNKPGYHGSFERIGIDHSFQQVSNNLEKVQLQNQIAYARSQGCGVFIYVNGYWTPDLTLNIPDSSYVEIVYDQSVIETELHAINGLRTFDSVKDDCVKYLLFRDTTASYIEYQDDTEIYIAESSGLVKKGVFFYKHHESVMRNVTDKDYSLRSSYVNNMAQELCNVTGGGLADKTIVMYRRKSGRDMELKYSALKLHELYKLPVDAQRDVISSAGYSLDSLRVENLENSDYFRLASASSVSQVTPELATAAVGYNGVSHYFAQTPVKRGSELTIEVAELYQGNSLAFEYDNDGLFKGQAVLTNGPYYTCSGPDVRFVEFMYGQTPSDFGRLYEKDETFTLLYPQDDYVILAAYFDGSVRQSTWTKVSGTSAAVQTGSTVTLSLPDGQKAKVIYMNQPNVYDLQLSTDDGVLYFPLTCQEDRGLGMMTYHLDVAPESLAVFLNNRRLTQGLGYFIDFPYVCITSKKYLNTDSPVQNVHVRMSGVTLDSSKINNLEVRGFVNHGALSRNKRYDIRDDRVYSVFVDGLMQDKGQIYWSEADNVVRLNHAQNGLPYTVAESMIPVKPFTGVDTVRLFEVSQATNTKIMNLFNMVMPEPAIDQFNVIGSAYIVYSPVVCKLIGDILTGVIPSTLYTTPYDDMTVHTLIETRYKSLLKVDPVRHAMPDVNVEIQPHISNLVVNMSLLQYRFVANFVRVITSNNPSKVELSGRLSVST
ncbi:MAG: hypothetical protein PHN51_10110 [Candidatus Nanopelagicales bacterium]|nr:hypothetical protein [Candidatus Nanopelagicales bacterium]